MIKYQSRASTVWYPLKTRDRITLINRSVPITVRFYSVHFLTTLKFFPGYTTVQSHKFVLTQGLSLSWEFHNVTARSHLHDSNEILSLTWLFCRAPRDPSLDANLSFKPYFWQDFFFKKRKKKEKERSHPIHICIRLEHIICSTPLMCLYSVPSLQCIKPLLQKQMHIWEFSGAESISTGLQICGKRDLVRWVILHGILDKWTCVMMTSITSCEVSRLVNGGLPLFSFFFPPLWTNWIFMNITILSKCSCLFTTRETDLKWGPQHWWIYLNPSQTLTLTSALNFVMYYIMI